ncbi:MAG: type III pantothenate kinase [Rhodanobacteraceae bacterium]
MILLLDLGNSRLKWAFADTRLGTGGALDWRQAGLPDALRRQWQQATAPSRVLGASVTRPERRALVDSLLNELGWPRAEWLRSPATHGPWANAYPQPDGLGIDRCLAMLAALDAGLAPCVIASCGTALTMDALADDGRHLGGQIIPGIDAMMSALNDVVPSLPDARSGQCLVFARNTVDAMHSGAWHASAGAIEHFLEATASAMQASPRLLLCGGHADAFGALLRVRSEYFPRAVLSGLLAWSRHP